MFMAHSIYVHPVSYYTTIPYRTTCIVLKNSFTFELPSQLLELPFQLRHELSEKSRQLTDVLAENSGLKHELKDMRIEAVALKSDLKNREPLPPTTPQVRV